MQQKEKPTHNGGDSRILEIHLKMTQQTTNAQQFGQFHILEQFDRFTIERGIFGPRFENIEKLAEALDVDVKTLFDFPE